MGRPILASAGTGGPLDPYRIQDWEGAGWRSPWGKGTLPLHSLCNEGSVLAKSLVQIWSILSWASQPGRGNRIWCAPSLPITPLLSLVHPHLHSPFYITSPPSPLSPSRSFQLSGVLLDPALVGQCRPFRRFCLLSGWRNMPYRPFATPHASVAIDAPTLATNRIVKVTEAVILTHLLGSKFHWTQWNILLNKHVLNDAILLLNMHRGREWVNPHDHTNLHNYTMTMRLHHMLSFT